MEHAVVFALGAMGAWVMTQQALANSTKSDPSTSQVYTRTPSSLVTPVDVVDPRRKNCMTDASNWQYIDTNTYNTLKANATYGRYGSPTVNWWFAGEKFGQSAPPLILNDITHYTVGPMQSDPAQE